VEPPLSEVQPEEGASATIRNRVRKSRRIGIIKKIVAIITGS
jgi:DNA-binding Lrp family transcriptional regulator